jgi:uncharacterized protein (DUF2336 family)
MKWLLQKFFGRRSTFIMRQVRDPVRYEREKKEARSDNIVSRMKLALSPHTHQEILYYMAQHDRDPAVRDAVAKNPSTPIQASMVIAADESYDVRLALAEKLVRLLPELSRDEHAQLYTIAVQALGLLAQDEVLKIRIALTSALKHHAFAPPAVVEKLARDVERSVAEPILRFCAALPDDVLLDILKNTHQDWAVEAIAARDHVSEPVSIAVIDTGNIKAGSILIQNQGAQLGREVLMDIIARARAIPAWQDSLALRKGLPPEVVKALNEFASEEVKQALMRHNVVDAVTTGKVAYLFKRRLSYASADRLAKENSGDTPYDRAVAMARSGTLSEAVIADAHGFQDIDFVIAALACRARVSIPDVRRVFALQKPRPIVALCWRAGMSMRFALQLQQNPGRVPYQDWVYPRDGTDYPLTEGEMIQILDFLGMVPAAQGQKNQGV